MKTILIDKKSVDVKDEYDPVFLSFIMIDVNCFEVQIKNVKGIIKNFRLHKTIKDAKWIFLGCWHLFSNNKLTFETVDNYFI